MPRLSDPVSVQNSSAAAHLPLRVAVWLLESPRLGRAPSVKRFARRLLKQPALHGVVSAQSRLGRLLCCDCGNPRDRRIGVEMLRQAARAGDQAAQLELGRFYSQPRDKAPQQALHWLNQAAAQGSPEAKRLLGKR